MDYLEFNRIHHKKTKNIGFFEGLLLPKTKNTRAFFEYLMFVFTIADVCVQEVYECSFHTVLSTKSRSSVCTRLQNICKREGIQDLRFNIQGLRFKIQGLERSSVNKQRGRHLGGVPYIYNIYI